MELMVRRPVSLGKSIIDRMGGRVRGRPGTRWIDDEGRHSLGFARPEKGDKTSGVATRWKWLDSLEQEE